MSLLEPIKARMRAWMDGADAQSGLDDRRYLVVSLVAAIAAACVAALWAFEHSAGLLSPVARRAYPALMALFGGGVAIIRCWPRWRSLTERVVYAGISAYFVGMLASFMLTDWHRKSLYFIANTLQWMPLVHVAAFVVFPRPLAFRATGLLFGASLAPTAVAVLARDRHPWDPTIGALVVNAHAIHALLVLMLSFFIVVLRQFELSQRRAGLMEHFAYTDGLTGIANRRGLEQRLGEHSPGAGGCVGLVLLDVDRFKSVNDRFGHAAGDALLVLLAQRIAREIRGTDLLGRWGGEEFLVAVPALPGDGGAAGAAAVAANAARLAERIRQGVGAAPHAASGAATVSAGVAVWAGGETLHAALRRADEALYAAKALGRDRVEVR